MVEVQAAGGVKRHRRFTEEDLERIRRMQLLAAAAKPEDAMTRSMRLERTEHLALMASMGLCDEQCDLSSSGAQQADADAEATAELPVVTMACMPTTTPAKKHTEQVFLNKFNSDSDSDSEDDDAEYGAPQYRLNDKGPSRPATVRTAWRSAPALKRWLVLDILDRHAAVAASGESSCGALAVLLARLNQLCCARWQWDSEQEEQEEQEEQADVESDGQADFEIAPGAASDSDGDCEQRSDAASQSSLDSVEAARQPSALTSAPSSSVGTRQARSAAATEQSQQVQLLADMFDSDAEKEKEQARAVSTGCWTAPAAVRGRVMDSDSDDDHEAIRRLARAKFASAAQRAPVADDGAEGHEESSEELGTDASHGSDGSDGEGTDAGSGEEGRQQNSEDDDEAIRRMTRRAHGRVHDNEQSGEEEEGDAVGMMMDAVEAASESEDDTASDGSSSDESDGEEEEEQGDGSESESDGSDDDDNGEAEKEEEEEELPKPSKAAGGAVKPIASKCSAAAKLDPGIFHCNTSLFRAVEPEGTTGFSLSALIGLPQDTMPPSCAASVAATVPTVARTAEHTQSTGGAAAATAAARGSARGWAVGVTSPVALADGSDFVRPQGEGAAAAAAAWTAQRQSLLEDFKRKRRTAAKGGRGGKGGGGGKRCRPSL
jgi:hypothetical protein